MRDNVTHIHWESYKRLPLPDSWFISDEEAAGSTIDYKGWVYRQYGKNRGEIPCFLFDL